MATMATAATRAMLTCKMLQSAGAGASAAAGGASAASSSRRVHGTGGLVKRGKGRRRVGLGEIGRMQAVLRHSAFVADPFAAVSAHLQNTIGAHAAAGGGGGGGGKKKKGRGGKGGGRRR